MVDFLNGSVLRVALYFLAAASCALAARRQSARGTGRAPLAWSWWALALTLVALGLFREIDAGAWITDRVRDAARSGGWYRDRRPLQRDILAVLTVAVTVLLVAFVATAGGRLRPSLPALVVCAGLCWFAAVRAVSLHSVDQLLYNRTFHGLRLATAIEVTATLTVSWLALRARGPGPPPA